MTTKNLFPYESTHAMFLASNTLSNIAFKAAKASYTDADSNLVALLFSAAWFEASLNEAISDLLEGTHREETEKLRRIRLAVIAAGLGDRIISVERKLRVLCTAATDASMEGRGPPWHEILLLFRLRNWTVHLRPERLNVRLGTGDEPSSLVSTQVHELITELLAVGAIAEVPKGRMVPVALAARLAGVGAWAYRSSFQGLCVIDNWLPERYRSLTEAHHPPSGLDTAV